MLSALLLLPLLAQLADRRLPEVALEDFTGTPARTLDDHLGQVVLLDFFAHWCAPCAKLIPHLNELQRDLGKQGLVVLGVTGDDLATADEWLKRFGAHYPFARDATLRLQIELGFRPLPTAVLVDAYGLIVWQGNPGELPVETLEACLADALELPAYRWPASAAEVRAALRAGHVSEALERARAMKDAPLASFVERFLARRLGYMDDAFARQDLLEAAEQATWISAGSKGEAKERADAIAKKIATTPEALPIVNAQRELRTLWSGVGQVTKAAQADELAKELGGLAAAHPGTQVERSVKEYIATLTALKTVLP